jgi:hypothetical protein
MISSLTARKRYVFNGVQHQHTFKTHLLIILQKEGVTHNLVATCRRSGMPAQMAFNYVGNMLLSRYRDWYLALAELPSWGEQIDHEVQEYIRGVTNVVRANLNWR